MEHKISPIGIAAIGLAVVALLAYVVLWVVSRNRRPSLAAVLEPYRMTGGAGQEVAGPPPLITVPWLQRVAGRVQAPLGLTRVGASAGQHARASGLTYACRGAHHDLGPRRRDLPGAWDGCWRAWWAWSLSRSLSSSCR